MIDVWFNAAARGLDGPASLHKGQGSRGYFSVVLQRNTLKTQECLLVVYIGSANPITLISRVSREGRI